MMFSIVFDIICIAIIIGCTIFFAVRGLLSGILSLAGTLISLVVAFFASRALAGPIFEAFIRQGLIDRTVEIAAEKGVNNLQGLLDSVVGFLPDAVTDMMVEQFGIQFSLDVNSFAVMVVDNVLAPIITALIAIGLFILLFVILRAIFALIARATRKTNEVPVLGGVNRLLGAVCGILVGLLYVFILVQVMSIVGWFNATSGGTHFLDTSFFYGIFSNLNILKL